MWLNKNQILTALIYILPLVLHSKHILNFIYSGRAAWTHSVILLFFLFLFLPLVANHVQSQSPLLDTEQLYWSRWGWSALLNGTSTVVGENSPLPASCSQLVWDFKTGYLKLHPCRPRAGMHKAFLHSHAEWMGVSNLDHLSIFLFVIWMFSLSAPPTTLKTLKQAKHSLSTSGTPSHLTLL